jgi:hypothetical protein
MTGDFEPWKLPAKIVPDVGGRSLGKPIIIREIRDPATGMMVPIANGLTGEGALKIWQEEHGDIDEPAFVRQQRRAETGEI